MKTRRAWRIVLFLLILALAACNSPTPEPLPTSVPVAELPTATATSLPPTIDFAELVDTPAPTPIPPTHTPAATATAVSPQIGITSPPSGSEMMQGSDVTVRGLLEKQSTHSVWLVLMSANGRLLLETEAAANDQSWEASFTVPIYASGAAVLQAEIRDESGAVTAENQLPINLIVDQSSTDRVLALYHPLAEETAVGGFNLFFDGMVYRPTNSAIAISVWTDDCQTRIARQSFTLGQSTVPFYWQGFVIVPNDAVGPACAVAHFGEEGSEDYREAVMLINILPADDPEAKGIRISSPPPDSHITAGRELFLYGTAQNVSEKPVSVSILMENGRIISQSTAPADYWGYWEFHVTIPPDVFGPAQVTISSGDAGGDNYAETQILINVDPAPTTPES